MENPNVESERNVESEQAQQMKGKQTGEQSDRLFSQADVDRIVSNRLARLKQDMESTDTYRRERDEARKELEEYKNNAFLREKGVKEADLDYVSFKVSKIVNNDETDFKQAAESFLQDNPCFAGRRGMIVSTGVSGGDHGSGDMEIRRAMGLKG